MSKYFIFIQTKPSLRRIQPMKHSNIINIRQGRPISEQVAIIICCSDDPVSFISVTIYQCSVCSIIISAYFVNLRIPRKCFRFRLKPAKNKGVEVVGVNIVISNSNVHISSLRKPFHLCTKK